MHEYRNERPRRVQVNVRLPMRVKQDVMRRADKMGISFNDYVTLAVRDYLKNQKEQVHV